MNKETLISALEEIAFLLKPSPSEVVRMEKEGVLAKRVESWHRLWSLVAEMKMLGKEEK